MPAQPKKTIRQLREGLGWSQRKLSVLLDVTVASVQNWETGRSEPKIAQQRKIMEAFHVGWDDVDWPRKTAKKWMPAA